MASEFERRHPKPIRHRVRLFAVIAARAAALVVVVLVMTACSPTPDRSEGPAPSQEEQTVAPSIAPSPSSAAFGWTEPPDYAFTLDSSCGERALIGRFRVEVGDHVVVRIEGLNAQGRNAASSIEPRLVPTLADLMELVVQARAAGVHEATIQFDPRDGNPTFVRIDREFTTIDDEECYAISNLSVVAHALSTWRIHAPGWPATGADKRLGSSSFGSNADWR